MKDLLKKLAVNAVGWTVVVILAFIYSSALRPLCSTAVIVNITIKLVAIYSLFMIGKYVVSLCKKGRRFSYFIKSLLWIIVFFIALDFSVNLSSIGFDAFAVFRYGWFGWLIVAYIFQKVIVKKKLDQKRFARIGLMVVISLLAIPKFIDDEPIENDWTFEEIAPSPEVQKSYSQLRKFMSTDIDANFELKLVNCEDIWGISQKDSILADKVEIEKLWRENANFINEFAKLNEFEEITDFKHGLNYENNAYFSLSQMRNMYLLYSCMIHLKAEEGDFESALKLFEQSHSIALKGLKGATSFINFMIWNALTNVSMVTAQELMEFEDIEQKDAKALLSILTEIDEEYSMVNSLKGEYLNFKYMLENVEDSNEDFYKIGMLPTKISLQKNKTLKIMKAHYEAIIDYMQKFPEFDKPKQDEYFYVDNFPLEVGNLSGWVLTRIAMPSYCSSYENFYKTKIKNEILRLKLTEMIGGDTAQFIDPYTEKPFVKNKDGEYYSPGLDRKFDTEDDVTL